MLRVVELDIDGELSGDTGVWEIAWVEMPAIERELIFFSKEFEFVYPASGEDKPQFIGRCMGSDKMVVDFPDSDQRSAVCYSYWDRKDEFSIVDKVSFDWESVVSKSQGSLLMRLEQYRGSQLYIITTQPIVTREMMRAAQEYNIPISRVIATGSDSGKVRKVKELGVKRHYDENLFIRNNLRGIAVNFDYDVSSLPDYDNYPTSGDSEGMLVQETFETYDDYPEGARNNACRAIKWKEENGSDCGTQVGWTRARQLCDGERLSRETIARMSSFERHRQNSDTPYSEGCGGIMWDAWGGDSGVRWAQNKLDEIDKEEFAKVGSRGGITESKKAPKSGTKNPNPKGEGTAKGDASGKRGAKVSAEQEKTLQGKVDDFNEKDSNTKNGRATLGALKAVFQRGLGAYNTSRSPNVRSASQWAYARVNAYLYLLKNGRPENKKYTTDYDLLPNAHPKAGKMSSEEEKFLKDNPCWDGYEPVGTKMKNGRRVPNCVPVSMSEEFTDEDWEIIEMIDLLKSEERFEAVRNQVLRGFTRDEVLKQNHKDKTTYYQYKRVLSGSPDRDFCTSIEGRFFRITQIYALQDYNTEMGHNQEPYSKWLYKGGPNCVHAWSKWEALQKDFREIGLVAGKPGTPPKSMPNNGYYNEETKRKSEVAYIVSQQNMSSQREQLFRSVDDKKMIYTPLMVPNILIPRIDDVSGERYYVKFKPEVIEKIQQKFMIEQRLRETNYEHSDKKFSDAVMVESWIVAGDSDKSYSLGFTKEQVPQGSWMGGYKILDTDEGNDLWNKYIKTGKVKGMSVEGNFLLEFSRTKTDDYLLEQIINILNKLQ